jgi:hypothetical protein
MARTIYITEDIAKELESMVQPMTELPQDIKNVLRNHKTSLGIHPSFPPEEEIPFDVEVTKMRFEEVCSEVQKLNLADYSPKSIQREIRTLTDKCKEIEKNFKQKLENICFNYVIDLFQVPEGLVAFKCELVETVNTDKANIKKDETIFEFEDISHRSRLSDAVYKRRMINALITGGAMRLSYISKELVGELYEISPELPSLYRSIMVLNGLSVG